MATEFLAIPDWSPVPNQGTAVAVADVDGDGHLDLVVLRIEAPDGPNIGSFRVGWKLDAAGAVTGGWGPWTPVPDWFSWQNDDAGLAVADVDGDGRPELVVFMIDAPDGPNVGYYRVGWKLDATGAVTGGWGPWTPVPDWFSWENQGGDVAVADLDGDGRPELIVVMVDAPDGPNAGYYRVGWKLDATGAVTAGWGPWTAIPDWFTWENQGAGVAIGDLDGDGRPELAVLAVDNPAGHNAGYVTVGWALDGTGRPADGWGPWTAVPGWRFWENAGAGAAFASVGAGRPSLLVAACDDAPGGNAGYVTAVDLALDIDTADMAGVWRLLDFGTEVLAVHAALLHTGDVMFFSGSSNNPANLAAHDFRTRVWHYPQARLSAPATPIDLFCCGHALLADGRLLAAGGTEQYDPFHGLHDAVVFNPATLTWTAVAPMAGGRWYPSLLTLADGRVLALAGLGGDGNLNVVPEAYTDGAGWAALASPGPWPMYAHQVLLADGRVFYTGGQYGGNNGSRPAVWNVATGATTEVHGLTVPDMRNQSASVLLPPAQAQRVMILGGGGYDMHNQAPAIADVAIADLNGPAPAYTAGPPLQMARMHLNAVLLPDRTVLATGGAAMEEAAAMSAAGAEIYDPGMGRWMMGADARVPRLYHSIALLMPDGKVVTAGSNPQRTQEELRIEVYWPPYLFRGPRPVLTPAVAAAAHGASIAASSPQAGVLRDVSLVRPGATTHSCDNEQRLMDVPFTVNPDGSLRLDLPTSANLAPPGWYLLFGTDQAGVPSTGSWLHLG